MSTSIRISPNAALYAIFVALLLALGAIVHAGAWLIAAALGNGHAGWMALFAALGTVVLLRFVGIAPGTSRAILALLGTAATIALGNWLVAALPIAQAMNLTPLEAALRMGPHFCWMLVSLGNAPLDWLWVALALALAAWFGR
jgi:hypothetical protein